MIDIFYAVLITNHFNNCNVSLNDWIFKTREDAEKYIKEMAEKYIECQKNQKKNNSKYYQFNSNTVFSGPSENCQFAEISYKIEEVKLY